MVPPWLTNTTGAHFRDQEDTRYVKPFSRRTLQDAASAARMCAALCSAWAAARRRAELARAFDWACRAGRLSGGTAGGCGGGDESGLKCDDPHWRLRVLLALRDTPRRVSREGWMALRRRELQESGGPGSYLPPVPPADVGFGHTTMREGNGATTRRDASLPEWIAERGKPGGGGMFPHEIEQLARASLLLEAARRAETDAGARAAQALLAAAPHFARFACLARQRPVRACRRRFEQAQQQQQQQESAASVAETAPASDGAKAAYAAVVCAGCLGHIVALRREAEKAEADAGRRLGEVRREYRKRGEALEELAKEADGKVERWARRRAARAA